MAVQTHSQEAPRVDCAGCSDGRLLPPHRAYFLQPGACGYGSNSAPLAPRHHLVLVQLRDLRDPERPLRVPLALLPVTRVPRLPPPQIQPEFRLHRTAGLSARHRHSVEGKCSVQTRPVSHWIQVGERTCPG